MANALPFYYTGVTASISGNASATLAIQLDTGTYFKWMCILGSSSLDAAADVRPNNFSLTPSLQSIGKLLNNNVRVPQRLMCGTAERPAWFPAPVVLNPGEIIQFDILNLSASTNVVTISLFGYKLQSATDL